jgi:CRISPR-associated protein Cmr1
VITPIFGGGVEAGANDPVTPIRPSSIRGHLRFWWRATRGVSCTNVADLRRKEGEIWGTMENPSQVGLQLEIKSQGKIYPCAHIPENRNFPQFEKNHPPYALFPFQGNKREGISPSKCTSNVSFEIRLTYPGSVSLDVTAAVWAWTNFGGIGARTRRGCGALYCKELSPPEPNASKIKLWYESCLDDFGIAPSIRNWPTLPNSLLVQSCSNVMQAWTDVVGLMQTFRQGEKVGRDTGRAPKHPDAQNGLRLNQLGI